MSASTNARHLGGSIRRVSEILRLFDRRADAIPNLFACRSWTDCFVRTLLGIGKGATVMNS
jgi:hypothetical protein